MPKIPIFNARTYGGGVDFGRLGPEAYGAGAFRGIAGLGAVLQDAQLQQDEIEVKRQAVMLDTRLEELKEEIKEEPDFAKRDKLYEDRATEYLKTATDSLTSDNVKAGLNSYYSIKFPREMVKVRVGTQKEWGESRIAQTESLGDMMADRIVSSDDPAEAAKYQALYKGQLQQLSQGPYAPLNEVQRQRMESAFETKVTTKRAQRMINQDAPSFLRAADEGQFSNLTEDVVYRFREQARTKIEQNEARDDRVMRQIKEASLNNWNARANRGDITAAEMTELLNGNNPYVSAREARTLNEVNSNPLAGAAAGTAVQAIMSEYYLGERTIPRINATRARLRALQVETGQPDPLIMKAANELQGDQTAAENTAISRDNVEYQRKEREARSLVDSLQANQPAMPFNSPLFTNQQRRTEAQIKDAVRKGDSESAKKLSEGKGKPLEKVPERNRKVMELGR